MESNLKSLISLFADVITLGGVLVAFFYAISNKNKNVLALKISLFIHYIFKASIIMLILTFLFYITDGFYFFIIMAFKGDVDSYYWEQGYVIQHLIAYLITYGIGIALAWVSSSIIWTSSFNYAIEFINLFLPKKKMRIKQPLALEIINATYGSDNKTINVTQKLRDMVVNNKLTIKAGNEIAGDPDIGVQKSLKIHYKIEGKSTMHSIREDTTVTIPLEVP